MKITESSEAFTYHVLSKIDPEIMDSFTQRQLDAIYQVIAARKLNEKHPVDVRAVMPLFFFRIYVVFLMGRDKRPKVRLIEAVRRRESDVSVSVFLMILSLIPIFLLLALVYYFLKVEYGIDYFADFHFFDLIL